MSRLCRDRVYECLEVHAVKSHEDTLSCYDVLHVIGVAASVASFTSYVFKPQHSVFDRSWAFYHSTDQYIENVNKPPKKWYEDSSDEEDRDPRAKDNEHEDDSSSESGEGSETEDLDKGDDRGGSDTDGEDEEDADNGAKQASALSCLPTPN